VREARISTRLAGMSRRIGFDQTQRARALRNAATRHERKLWAMLSRLRPKFTRQLPVGPYFADFACRQAKLIVELDVGQHAESGRDQRRDAFLRQEGWAVLRIWNNELDDNPGGVVDTIVARAAECLGGTHPQPLPSREGRTRRDRYGAQNDKAEAA
jgi:very-short-patch-repair endonuclease